MSALTKWESAERARHAFQIYFENQISQLEVKINLKGLSKLPVEIRQIILNLSWPCPLHMTVVSMAEASNLQSLIVSHESTNRPFIFSGKGLYLTRITRAGVPYVSDISYVTSTELVWEGGPITEIVIASDGIGVIGINIKGCKATAAKCEQIRAEWYKSIVSLAEKPLDQITIHRKV
jgi:hypothetical protein